MKTEHKQTVAVIEQRNTTTGKKKQRQHTQKNDNAKLRQRSPPIPEPDAKTPAKLPKQPMEEKTQDCLLFNIHTVSCSNIVYSGLDGLDHSHSKII
jgi:hypothetical protein